MKKIALIAAIATATILAGCASAGNMALKDANQQQIDAHLIKGKSTKADVVNYLGAADQVSFGDGGHEQWTYNYAHASAKAASFIPVVGLFAGGQNVDKKSLTILFDDSGIVRKYTFAASTGEVRTGLAQ